MNTGNGLKDSMPNQSAHPATGQVTEQYLNVSKLWYETSIRNERGTTISYLI